MTRVTVEEAQARLPELIAHLREGEAVIITHEERPIAKLVGEVPPTQPKRRFGTLQHAITYMAEDFDAPLEDFREYME